ncbi:hypothetical protein F4692_000686 [Nocardioides cavernae]|uniref:Uncharacterized protein n=1 Tax=Nocardioides cavernae TaxID=1921566 RepID=A0A7Y9H0C2_9ACTN|nr:hypothetical protein [Nocardioides cavernae]NYE35582.1 hypothetical protein [Nocardioides cavernae]
MSDDDQTQPVRPQAPDPTPDAAVPTGPVERRGFRERLRSVRRSDGDRAYSLGALVASALAGIIVGGMGMATLHAVTDDGPGGGPGDRGRWTQHREDRGDGDGPGPGRDGMRGGQPGPPGQTPTTPPEDEGSAS